MSTSRPPLFSSETLAAATAHATAEGRLLLVDFTASWCGPCRHMDATTWRAPEVEAWVAQHAVAVQLDADTAPAATAWGVKSLPTVVLQRGGVEVDRISGARPSAALVAWLDGAAAGQTDLERLKSLPVADLQGRLELATALVERGADDEATDAFAWLWGHSLEVDETWVGVRGSFLIDALKPLLKRSGKARAVFETFFDVAGRTKLERRWFRDWVTLSTLLGREREVLDWLGVATAQEVESLSLHRDNAVLRLLGRHESWAVLARFVADPVAVLREEHEMYAHTLATARGWAAELLDDTRWFFEAAIRTRAVALCHAMAAAGRRDAVQSVIEAARRLDASVEMVEATAPFEAAT